MSTEHGIPSLRGTEHIGFTVPDLRQAVDFFVDVIGCEAFFPLGPYEPQGSWMEDNLNVHPRSEIPRMCILRCKTGVNFEIFEYQAPDQRETPPKNSDVGGHHIAFYVEDIDDALAYLKCKDVKILGDKKVVTEGPVAGESWVYFLTPWGMQLELVSYPQGLAYETSTKRRLWNPAEPTRE